MNVLFIIASLTGGGAEKILGYLSKNLSEKGINVFLVTFASEKTDYNYGGELIRIKSLLKGKNKLCKLINFIYIIFKVKKIKKLKKIDKSISFLPKADIINYFSKKNDKIISSIRNNLSENFKESSKIKVFLQKFIIKRFDKIIAISIGIKENLIKNFEVSSDRISVIYNFIEEKNLEDASLKQYNDLIEPTKIKILNMGRMVKQKGQWNLIKAAKILKEKRNDFIITILGQGIYMDELLKMSKNLEVEDVVKIKDFTNNPYPIIKTSDIFIFSSLYEGLGNSILEAGFFNNAIISSDCNYGPREILSENKEYNDKIKGFSLEKYGILVEKINDEFPDFTQEINRDSKNISDAIEFLLDNEEIRKGYSLKIKERIKEFNTEDIIKKWLKEI